MTLAAFQASTDDLVRDRDGVISSLQRDTAISNAVARYSADRARPRVVDVVSVGGRFTDTPAGWVDGFSQLIAIEFPIGETPPAWIQVGEASIYRSPSAVQIQLPLELTAGESIRYTFTGPHVVDNSTDTVPSADMQPVAAYAASLLCDQLASYYATESAPTIGADTVDHQNKSRTFAARAKVLREQYATTLRIDIARVIPASNVVDLDRAASDGGGRLFHPRRVF
ncbi:MAG: hypothetical protein HYV17_08035 [Xanthomonadales bacterium]|nr:hypothetical protein [Xanthomonadales bacterium]